MQAGRQPADHGHLCSHGLLPSLRRFRSIALGETTLGGLVPPVGAVELFWMDRNTLIINDLRNHPGVPIDWGHPVGLGRSSRAAHAHSSRFIGGFPRQVSRWAGSPGPPVPRSCRSGRIPDDRGVRRRWLCRRRSAGPVRRFPRPPLPGWRGRRECIPH